MRIVVTGATGFVGRPLTRRLVERGHEVVAWTRNPERARNDLPALCGIQCWNPHESTDPALLDGVDAVIHLAGESVAGSRWTAERKAEIHASRVEGSNAIVAAIEALPEISRPAALVSASAIGFYGDRGDEVLTEDAVAGEGFLADVCRAWEAAIARASGLGVRTVSIRVGIVLGRDGGALEAMLPPFRLGAGGRIGSGRQWMSWIHVDDLVEMFVHAVEHTDVSGVWNGVAPKPATNGEFTTALGATLGRPTLVPVPAFALRIALGEMASVLVASQRVVPERPLAAGFRFRWPDLEPALVDLVGETVHEVVYEQWVPKSPEEIFPFFANAYNLERITPDFLNFAVLRVEPETVGEGTTIDYRLSLHGVPMSWRSVIEEWRPGRRFVDRQVRGPYHLWHHTHDFEPARGGTILRDRVRFALPAGGLGEVVAGGFVRRDVERIFAFRREKIAEIFGGAEGGIEPPVRPVGSAMPDQCGVRAG